MIGSSGILMGLAYAMYKNVDKDKRKQYKSMYLSAGLAVFLTGVTEPLEFMFMFSAMPLYGVYALIQGAAFAMADIINLRIHAFGSIELLTRTPLALRAGLGLDMINFLWVTVLFAVGTYFLADFLIRKFQYATPGRKGNYEGEANGSDAAQAVDASQQVYNIIHLLGGKDNISDVDACMTRLRVSVKDTNKVGSEANWKKAGAMGLVHKDTGVQAIYGPKADVLKSDILDVLESNVDIPASTIDENKALVDDTANDQTSESLMNHSEKTAVYSAADGNIQPITEAPDDVFSQKMMGDGYVITPSSDRIVSPVSGSITSIFPTKHAIGIQTENGIDVLVHMGIDTVELNGQGFELFVEEGQTVKAGDELARMDREAISKADKNTAVLVVFTNLTDGQIINLNATGECKAADLIGSVME
jgi:PTS system glucose-specific IIC component